MKSMEEIFFESEEDDIRSKMNLGKEYNFYYKGKWVIDTFHKLDREKQRESESRDLFRKAINWLLTNKSKGGMEYLFVSKSTKMAMVVDYRKDKANRVKGNNLIIVSWLGNTVKDLKKDPKDVFVKKEQRKYLLKM